MAKKKRTAKAIQRKAFEKEYSKVYKVPLKVAREARRLFENHTLEDATKKLLTEHPRIAKSKLAPAKAAVTRKEREREEGGGDVLPPGKVAEFICSLTYREGRTFDVIVTATNAKEARAVLTQFLEDDIRGRRIVRANFRGWDLRIARGELTEEQPGEAEYRNDSSAEKK
jgi:hypothetical protein